MEDSNISNCQQNNPELGILSIIFAPNRLAGIPSSERGTFDSPRGQVRRHEMSVAEGKPADHERWAPVAMHQPVRRIGEGNVSLLCLQKTACPPGDDSHRRQAPRNDDGRRAYRRRAATRQRPDRSRWPPDFAGPLRHGWRTGLVGRSRSTSHGGARNDKSMTVAS